MDNAAEIQRLLELSGRIGRDPLLIQASSGNTSIKLGNTLWIKASGKWLAHAVTPDLLVPVTLDWFHTTGRVNHPNASIETAMHAVLPHRVVIHVHSVNTLAWAVRLDASARVGECLAGLNWRWIPYVMSGQSLARAIQRSIHTDPEATVFVLGNHGLVICGEDCDSAENLLGEVERRLAVVPRRYPDSTSERILAGGFLYPCQAVFLGPSTALEPAMTPTQRAVLDGLLEVVRRVDPAAPIRYLSDAEISTLLNEDAHRYRLVVEQNAVSSQNRLM